SARPRRGGSAPTKRVRPEATASARRWPRDPRLLSSSPRFRHRPLYLQGEAVTVQAVDHSLSSRGFTAKAPRREAVLRAFARLRVFAVTDALRARERPRARAPCRNLVPFAWMRHTDYPRGSGLPDPKRA